MEQMIRLSDRRVSQDVEWRGMIKIRETEKRKILPVPGES